MGSLAHALPPFLGSGPRDHVFVYFTDHGATGILVFPSDDVSSAYHFDRGFLSLPLLLGPGDCMQGLVCVIQVLFR